MHISAAMAALTFRRIAILLMVTHLSLSTPLITMTSASASFHPRLRIAFHVAESLRVVDYFSPSLRDNINPMISMFKLSMFEIGMATSSFHHECHVFGTSPIFPSSVEIRN